MRFLPAALLALLVVAAPLTPVQPATAQAKKATNLAVRCAQPAFAKANPRSCAKYVDKKPAAEPATTKPLPCAPRNRSMIFCFDIRIVKKCLRLKTT